MYRIEYSRSAAKELAVLPKLEYSRVKKLVDSLALDPFPVGYLKLEGSDKVYRIRKGNYRVICTVTKEVIIVTILKIAHRKDVYR